MPRIQKKKEGWQPWRTPDGYFVFVLPHRGAPKTKFAGCCQDKKIGSTTALKDRQAELVLEQLFTRFSVELKKLITAQSFPDNYSQVSDQISNWLHHRLLKYYPSDRQYIAQFILRLMTHLSSESVVDQSGTQNEVSLVLFCCFLKATKNYLAPEALSNLAAKLDRSFAQRRTESPLSIFEESIYQELQQQLTYQPPL